MHERKGLSPSYNGRPANKAEDESPRRSEGRHIQRQRSDGTNNSRPEGGPGKKSDRGRLSRAISEFPIRSLSIKSCARGDEDLRLSLDREQLWPRRVSELEVGKTRLDPPSRRCDSATPGPERPLP